MTMVRCWVAFCAVIVAANVGAQGRLQGPNVTNTIRADVLSDTKSGKPWKTKVTDFEGVRFGSSQAEVAAVTGPLDCDDPLNQSRLMTGCRPEDRSRGYVIGGVNLETIYTFHEGTLVAVRVQPRKGGWSLKSNAPSYEDALAAFVARYGPPTRETSVNRHGSVTSRNYAKKDQFGAGPQTSTRTVNTTRTCAEWSNASSYAQLCGVQGRFEDARIETSSAPAFARGQGAAIDDGSLMRVTLPQSQSKPDAND